MSAASLRLTGITKRYRNTTVLGPLSLELQKGRIYGLIGENGAGKSTLIRIIMGLSKQTTGDIEIFGQSGKRGLALARADIGYVPDSSASYPLLSAYDNLKARSLEWGADQHQIPKLLETVGLAQAGAKKARSFSLGMRRRLDLAVALLGNPSMLILDEPTNGLDPLGTIEMRNLIRRLNAERGITVIISSHNLAELNRIADEYLVLSSGSLIARLRNSDVETASQNGLEDIYASLVINRPEESLTEIRRS